jgi:molecular chaperone DnaK (HSP70)
MSARFSIGIDLGTTNCTVAAVALDGEGQQPVTFGVRQVVHGGEVAALERLPSFVFLPTEAERPGLGLPWDEQRAFVVGELARKRGAEVPARVVASAKSWLCHPGVDRRAGLLPVDAPDDVEKLSPVAASARYLSHLKEAWDAEHPKAPFAEQELTVTVPASFDAVARSLTEEAAVAAGLGGQLTLMEEPQAALYAFLADPGADWRKQVDVGDVVLVVDIGGGTTDFSLMLVVEEEGELRLDRLAVGEHILLGGDNMDLALAWKKKVELDQDGGTLDDWQLRGLTHSCRLAKEALLEDASIAERDVTVPGRGRKLIGGSRSATLTRDEVTASILDGFFPVVEATKRPQKGQRSALTTLGLPYAHDAGITRHLAAFLGGPALAGAVPKGIDPSAGFIRPTAVLFNGGVTRSPAVRDRIMQVLNQWIEGSGGQAAKVLAGTDPDAAVSRGAAYYGLVRRGQGVRIRGGTQRAYYVGIERAGLAVPGMPPQLDAVCIAPFGMEEGTEVELPLDLGLVVGEEASFRFFSSTERRDDDVAATLPVAGELEELPPIETFVKGDGEGGVVPVRLHSRITEVGTLELAAVEQGSGRRHQLSFDVRVD